MGKTKLSWVNSSNRIQDKVISKSYTARAGGCGVTLHHRGKDNKAWYLSCKELCIENHLLGQYDDANQLDILLEDAEAALESLIRSQHYYACRLYNALHQPEVTIQTSLGTLTAYSEGGPEHPGIVIDLVSDDGRKCNLANIQMEGPDELQATIYAELGQNVDDGTGRMAEYTHSIRFIQPWATPEQDIVESWRP